MLIRLQFYLWKMWRSGCRVITAQPEMDIRRLRITQDTRFLVVSVPHVLSENCHDKLRSNVEKLMPSGVRVMILENGMTIQAVDCETVYRDWSDYLSERVTTLERRLDDIDRRLDRREDYECDQQEQ